MTPFAKVKKQFVLALQFHIQVIEMVSNIY